MDQFLSYVALIVIAMSVLQGVDARLIRLSRARRPARVRPIQNSGNSKVWHA
jgi:hypothetical protein